MYTQNAQCLNPFFQWVYLFEDLRVETKLELWNMKEICSIFFFEGNDILYQFVVYLYPVVQ
jgi:hypothetical protein